MTLKCIGDVIGNIITGRVNRIGISVGMKNLFISFVEAGNALKLVLSRAKVQRWTNPYFLNQPKIMQFMRAAGAI